MRAEGMTLENCQRNISVLGLRLTYWRRVAWRDGYYQPPYFEVRTPTNRGFILRMGRYHPWGPTTHNLNGAAR